MDFKKTDNSKSTVTSKDWNLPQGNMKWHSHRGGQFGSFSTKLNINPQVYYVLPKRTGNMPMRIPVYKYSAASLVIAGNWKLSRCPSHNQWRRSGIAIYWNIIKP